MELLHDVIHIDWVLVPLVSLKRGSAAQVGLEWYEQLILPV